MKAPCSLEKLLRAHTKEGELYERLTAERVRCTACGHRCTLSPGQPGLCKVRFNEGGRLLVPTGYVAALQCDPIEKKPFYHVLPGAAALSFGMLSCSLHCPFCQNWLSSQALREPRAGHPPQQVSAEQVSQLAGKYRAPVIASTYNEPLISSEWAVELMRLARPHGVRGAYVSNGYATGAVLDYLEPWIDFFNVDLKCFDEARYRSLGCKRQGVLETIEQLVEGGFWVEVVTLVVPGFNDSEEELRSIARFLSGVSKAIPWHLTAFHPDYKMDDRGRTPGETLLRAAQLGKEEGLHFVYAGNLPGGVGDWENTYCPGCGALLVERYGFRVRQNRIRSGACPDCGQAIAGRWE